MNLEQAKDVIESLALGRDPQSGLDLPPDSICQQPETLRALFASLGALDRALRADRRAGSSKRGGLPWSDEEDQRLASGFTAGTDPKELAKLHERSVSAIQRRIECLGLLEDAEVSP